MLMLENLDIENIVGERLSGKMIEIRQELIVSNLFPQKSRKVFIFMIWSLMEIVGNP